MAKPTLNIEGIKNNVLFLSSQRNEKFLLKDWNAAGNWRKNPRKDFEGVFSYESGNKVPGTRTKESQGIRRSLVITNS